MQGLNGGKPLPPRSLEGRQEIFRGAFQGARQLLELENCQIASTIFDGADEALIQFAFFSQLLLRQAELKTPLPYIVADDPKDLHASTVDGSRSSSLFHIRNNWG